jgi:hypothetical protein
MKKDRARQVSISLTENEVAKYRKLAKTEGKSFSKWIRDKVEEAISKEKREIALLVYIIKFLELQAEYIVNAKQKEFKKKVEELKRSLGL